MHFQPALVLQRSKHAPPTQHKGLPTVKPLKPPRQSFGQISQFSPGSHLPFLLQKGLIVGRPVGPLLSLAVSVFGLVAFMGIKVGALVNARVGLIVVALVGIRLGAIVGIFVGIRVGALVGIFVGIRVGALVGIFVGITVGTIVGGFVGVWVGVVVGGFVGV